MASIDERLQKLELTITEHTATVRAHMESLKERDSITSEQMLVLFKKLNQHNETIHGKNGDPGLKGRLDRVEQRNKLIAWAGTTIIGVWLVQSAKHIKDFIIS